MRKSVPEDAVLIPDSASKVFTGVMFDIYQWPQTMFDGRTETFEMLRRPDTVQVLVIQDEKVLVITDEQPGRGARLSLPGGRIADTDSSWLMAAQRELLEETGITCTRWKLVEVTQPFHKLEWFVAFFVASDISAKIMPALDAGGERITQAWHDYDAARQNILSNTWPQLDYLRTVVERAPSVVALEQLLEFTGKEIDR